MEGPVDAEAVGMDVVVGVSFFFTSTAGHEFSSRLQLEKPRQLTFSPASRARVPTLTQPVIHAFLMERMSTLEHPTLLVHLVVSEAHLRFSD